MFSKPEVPPEKPKIYLVIDFDCQVDKAFLNPVEANLYCDECNGYDEDGVPLSGPYDLVEIEIQADQSEWRKHCPVCQAQDSYYKRTQDDLK